MARLTPVPQGSPLEMMRAAGEIEPASEDVDDLPEPLALPEGIEAPSAVLERLPATSAEWWQRPTSTRLR